MNRYRSYKATVEGTVDGVPFCNYFKRMDLALAAARRTGGTVWDLITLKAQRWNAQQRVWEQVA